VKRRINILIPTFQPNDAVGNDAAGMFEMLSAAGFDTHIYAEHIHHAYSSITEKAQAASGSIWSDPDALTIYHHAILWELGEQLLARIRHRIVVKYHNITPPQFFQNYGQHYYWACVKGKESNERLAKIPSVYVWGDSAFNTEELIQLGVPRDQTRVVAPVHRIEELAHEPFDNVVLGAYRGDRVNVLFVGGMRPNKGHAKAMEIAAALRRVTPRPFRFFFVGSFDPYLSSYTEDLEQYVKHLELSEDVIFARSVSPSQLRSYYLNASVFLCVSEHEGFCVPLVEAMAFRVPIVAWATTAVGETAGGCGLIHEQFDAEKMAESIAELIDNESLACEVTERGRIRYEETFHTEAIRRKLLGLVEEVFTL
jgi:glycosyltransferase involved in cell wall biosynthesis